MVEKLAVMEFLLIGAIAVACFAAPARRATVLGFSARLDRLRRSRWQWLSIVAIMLVLRLQHTFSPALELTIGLLFLILLALPARQVVEMRK